jgi:hypothetical protein
MKPIDESGADGVYVSKTSLEYIANREKSLGRKHKFDNSLV